ncbi:MAG: amino acid adenylation domain-containing protein [Gammaproteobacteria bacterium]|nr:amino acid adenylation domain-containing protein [Gammaproteobacteria bacterium]
MTAGGGLAQRRVVAATAEDAGARLPLSPAQEGFWLLQSLDPAGSAANEQFAIFLDGALDTAALAQAWCGVLARHEVLRARFGADDGQPWQRFDPQPGAAPRLVAGRFTPEQLLDFAAEDIARPFDLVRGPPLRAALLPLGIDSHVLLVTTHHIVADGLSVPIIRDDLAGLYADLVAGRSAESGTAPGYGAFALAEQQRAGGTQQARDLEWWRGQLAGAPARHALPQRLRAAAAATAAAPGAAMASRRVAFAIPAATAERARRLAQASGTTLFTLLTAALRVLLLRLGGQDDPLLAVPVTRRDDAARRRMVGCLINTVLLRTPLAPDDSFAALLARERATLLGALEHRELPFQRLVEALSVPRRPGEQPLAQVLLQFDLAPPPRQAGGISLRIEPLPVPRASIWDLDWSFTDQGAGRELHGHLGYACERFEDWLAEAMPRQLAVLLDAATREPERPIGLLPLLDERQRQQLLVEWNATAAAYPQAATLTALVAAQCRRTPLAVALESAAGSLRYAELARRVDWLAARLVAAGAVRGSRVALSMAPSMELVIALLAILRAGAACVPLDPAYPRARREFMLRDADACLLLVRGAVDLDCGATACLDLDALGGPAPGEAVPAVAEGATPDAPAWLLYTSGSTGEPKGAIGLHCSAVNRVHWMWQHCGFAAGDAFCLRTSLSFIDSLWEIFGALAHGIRLVLLPDGAASDPALLVPALARHRVTQLVLVPPLLRALLDWAPDLGARLPGLRHIITSGEPLAVDLWAAARKSLPAVRLLNTWGSSEIWDASCCDTSAIETAPERMPIGRPIANLRCYVLDAQLQLLPPGIPGELCVAGLGIGAGYWRRPELTAERFVPDPFGAPGEWLYRSGDRARWLPDGNLECLGRLDRQLKLHGYRIEPGEIEAVLRACPGVDDAAVLLREEQGLPQLLACVASRDAGLSPAELAAQAAQRLPRFMRPAAWLILPALPLTPSGKLDRAALPAPAAPGAALDVAAPAGDIELRLARLWSAVLGTAVPDRQQSFFELGGQSLLALRLLARVASEFGVVLTLRDFFDAPSIAGLAACIAVGSGREAPLPAPVPLPAGAPLPLSWGQERLWFLDQLDPASPAYNIAWSIVLEGPLDQGRLQRALDAVLARHAVLRSAYPAQAGRPLAVLAPGLRIGIRLECVVDGALEARRRALAREPFDLGRGPLLRATLLRLAVDRHELVLVLHHIVTDGTSNGILLRELADAYAGRPAPPPLPLQYADYAAWQRRWLDGERSCNQLDWWQEQLADVPPLLELPTDFARPAEQRFRGAWIWRSLDGQASTRLRRFAGSRQATLYMLLLAAFDVLLQRYSGRDDIVVGTPVSARPQVEFEGLVGLFVNTLVLRTDLGGAPDFDSLLSRVRTTATAAFAHQDAAFERLVERLQPGRSLARAPVFQVMFNLVPMPAEPLEAGDVSFRPGRLLDHGVSSFDLTLTVGEQASGLELLFEFDTDLFLPGSIECFADAYLMLLDAVQAAPGAPVALLPLVDAAEAGRQRRLLAGARAAAPPTADVASLFAEVVARRPAAAALTAAGSPLDYRALDQRSARIARGLVDLGLRPGDRVGICLPRVTDLVAALLGVLKAGAAYVMLEPEQPPARLAAMARDAGLSLLVVNAATSTLLPEPALPRLDLDAGAAALDALPPQFTAVPASIEDLAYLVYTSGSSGEPKAVAVTRGNLAATFDGWREAYGLLDSDVHLQLANAAFDVFTGDWVRALLSGAHLVLCPRELLAEPAGLHGFMRGQGITVAEFVPAVIRPLLAWCRDNAQSLAGLRLLVVGSEAWLPTEYQALREICGAATRVINSYGVAEATIDSAWFEGDAQGAARLPIGRPFPQASLRILDAQLQPVPAGMPGEICIGGAGVARGYWRRENLTAERFVPDPHAPAQRLYRTGDRGRLRPDGLVEFLGRMDGQLKLRGQRLEPGEVEAALAACAGVAQCAVDLRHTAAGEPLLVAWVVPAPAGTCSADGLRAALRRVLPPSLWPARFEFIERLPLTPNGKLDRRALPAPADAGAAATLAPGAARSALEATLCELFGAVLGSDAAVGVHDDFFALGGHSLLATRLVARIRDTLEVELPLRTLFEAPTVAGVAAALAIGAAAPMPGVARREAAASAPLSWPQQRLWFLEQLEPGNDAYHLHLAFRLRGTLDATALQAALDDLVARHEVLGSTITLVDGEALQHPGTAAPLRLASAAVDSDAQADALLREWIARPFDLAHGPLLRVLLLDVAAGERLLLLVMHHIVADGWSMAVLLHELSLLYNARLAAVPARLAPLPVQYADYALWQRDLLQSARMQAQIEFWKQRLAAAPETVSLPTDRPRPAVQRHRGAWFRLTLPPALVDGLRALAQREHATLFMLLLAGFQALLSRHGGDEDILVATPVAGRSHSALEGLVGFFVNTLVLRGDLRGNPTLAELLARTRRSALDAFAHAELPFEKLVEILQPRRSRAFAPLAQLFFVFHSQPRSPLCLDGASATPELVETGRVKFDLALHVAEEGRGLVAAFAYDSDLFDEQTVSMLAGGYARLLGEFARDAQQRLGEVAVLEGAQPQAVVDAQRMPAPRWGQRTLAERFAAVAAAQPSRPAVRDAAGEWSYAQLQAQADALAARLAAAGARGRVALLLGHDRVMVAAVLGTLRAGCAYVPLDPYAPPARQRRILAASGATAVVVDAPRLAAAGWLQDCGLPLLAAEAVADPALAPPPLPQDPEAEAYLLFTSGSTGEPRAVSQSHAHVLGLVGSWSAQLGIGAQDRLGLFSGYGYDAAVQDLFGALLNGATLHPLDLRGGLSAPELVDRIARERLTLLHFTPTVYRYLFGGRMSCDQNLAAVRLVVLGGEEARRSDLELFRLRFRRGTRFVNGLGLTECSTVLQYFADHDTRVLGERLPVGRPVPGVSLRLAEGGWQGAVQIDSPWLAPGHGPWYRSGDRLRRLPDGQWLHVGREDRQLKLRGQRIDPAEVEAVLLADPLVREAAVLLVEVQGEALLAAYVVADDFDAAATRARLRRQLPEFMVPGLFFPLAELPRKANGKLDAAGLPVAGRPAVAAVAARSDIERQLLELWCAVLGRDGIGIEDDFFALGGHSLLATRLIARVRDAFALELPLLALFEAPTIAGMAQRLAAMAPATTLPPIRRLPRSPQ